MVDHHHVQVAIVVIVQVSYASSVALEIDPRDVGDVGESVPVAIVAEEVIMFVSVPRIIADEFGLPEIAFPVGSGGRNCAPK
jgi:hypothetical protein